MAHKPNRRVLLVRADGPRHKALARHLRFLGLSVIEVETPKSSLSAGAPHSSPHEVIRSYNLARVQFEKDYFDSPDFEAQPPHAVTTDINSAQILRLVESASPDLIVTFGCPLLSSDWIKNWGDRLLGIHLGLSPYYRGSGTNFFPFVNRELAAVGFTLFRVTSGIDSGPILLQERAEFVHEDNIHTAGLRLIKKMFVRLGDLIEQNSPLPPGIAQDWESGRLYRRSDFNSNSVSIALENLRGGMVPHYLDEKDKNDSLFPIIHPPGPLL